MSVCRKDGAGRLAAVLLLTQALSVQAATTSFYVRHGGSDANDGSSWSKAFLTIQKAVDSAVLGGVTNAVFVQASSIGQFYGVAVRNFGWTGNTTFILELRGGWENVDTAPTQTGFSFILGNGANRGIDLNSDGMGGHGFKRYVTLDRFAISNVTDGVRLDIGGSVDAADGCLTLRHTTLYAKDHGVRLEYPKTHAISTGYGGLSRLTAENVDIRAGLGGSGHGVYIRGAWLGSTITATGTNPATGHPRVSGVSSAGGSGVYFTGTASETVFYAGFSNTVIYGSATNGIDAAGVGSTPVRLTLDHCTLADNGGHGLELQGGSAGSWASVTNSILANNAGHGINAGTNGGPAFACSEGWNNFHNDDVCLNGSIQASAASDVTGDPLFWTAKTGPDRYMLRWTASPSYLSDSTGRNRGAHQNTAPSKGTMVWLK